MRLLKLMEKKIKFGLATKLKVQFREGMGFEPTNKYIEFEGATILYINSKGKIIDQWGAFCFYDIFTDLGVVPQF